MLNRLTYKQKYYLSIASIALLSILLYKVSFSKSIGFLRSLSNQSEVSSGAIMQKYNALEKKKKELVVLSESSVELEDLDQFLISYLEQVCLKHKGKLITYSSPMMSTGEMVKLFSVDVSIEGSYKSITQIVNQIQMKGYGSITALDIAKSKKSNNLLATLTLKKIFKND